MKKIIKKFLKKEKIPEKSAKKYYLEYKWFLIDFQVIFNWLMENWLL